MGYWPEDGDRVRRIVLAVIVGLGLLLIALVIGIMALRRGRPDELWSALAILTMAAFSFSFARLQKSYLPDERTAKGDPGNKDQLYKE